MHFYEISQLSITFFKGKEHLILDTLIVILIETRNEYLKLTFIFYPPKFRNYIFLKHIQDMQFQHFFIWKYYI